MMKVHIYEVCIPYIIYCLLFYIRTILTALFFAIFVAFLTSGARSSGSIGHRDKSRKSRGIYMNIGGQGCKLMAKMRHAIIYLTFI